MQPQVDAQSLPPRVVHLLGGLRAIDDRSEKICVQVAHDQRRAHFPTPPYAQLYGTLLGLGLRPIGVEFVNSRTYQGLEAPDWECASPTEAFKIRTERHRWSEVRHAGIVDRAFDAIDIASRASTFLGLLPIRILQLSEAYNRALRANNSNPRPGNDTHFFDNSFSCYIEAAIHGFVADAASFRDLIAEAAWKLVLKEPEKVTTLGTFVKKAKEHPHPLAQTIVRAGQQGAWLKNLTDLRNHITHVAPVGGTSEHHFCVPRKMLIGPRIEVVTLHFPLFQGNGSMPQNVNAIDYNDEGAVLNSLERYRIFSATSLDALEYAWNTLSQMIDLLATVRSAAGLRSEQPRLTEKDLVGDITFL